QQQQQSQPEQQRPDGLSLAANPVLSGSSVPASRDLETSRLQSSLGMDIMNRFFPGLGSGAMALKRRSYNEKPAAAANKCKQPYRSIPFPPRLTPDWIDMHGFDPDRVEMFHKNACDLVEMLNNSTYISPY
ncbi:hypothetical protein LPJ59_000718, partial [Coemansia sp. RSA 2399]